MVRGSLRRRVPEGHAKLAAFLEDPGRPADTLGYHELRGFLFAVASGPQLVLPSEWMPEIFGGQEPEYASLEEASKIVGQIMSLYNQVNESALDTAGVKASDWGFRRDVMTNFDDDAPVRRWARGFVTGHQWLEESWEEFLVDEISEDMGSILMVLTFFASRELAEDYRTESGSKVESLEVMAKTMRRLFPQAAAEYAQRGRSIAQAIREAEAERHEPVRRDKVGRNDLCPCGSGRKYKKCCGARH